MSGSFERSAAAALVIFAILSIPFILSPPPFPPCRGVGVLADNPNAAAMQGCVRTLTPRSALEALLEALAAPKAQAV